MTFRDLKSLLLQMMMEMNSSLSSKKDAIVPSEIEWMLKSLSFKKIEIFGSKIGAYSREYKLST